MNNTLDGEQINPQNAWILYSMHYGTFGISKTHNLIHNSNPIFKQPLKCFFDNGELLSTDMPVGTIVHYPMLQLINGDILRIEKAVVRKNGLEVSKGCGVIYTVKKMSEKTSIEQHLSQTLDIFKVLFMVWEITFTKIPDLKQ